jgi:hypothetical protein
MAKKRRNRRPAAGGDGGSLPDAGRETARQLAEHQTRLVGELARYAVICGLLLVFAPGLGAVVAFFWGIGLARRLWAAFAVPRLRERLEDRALEASARDWRSLEPGERSAPGPRVALRPGELVDGALASRAERIARGGVELHREGACAALVKGDAERLARALGALVDAALDDAEARPAPRRLAVEIGESLAGSEVFLRLASPAAGGSAAPSGAGAPDGAALAAVRGVAEAHGGALEATATDAGLELLLTLPSA